MRAAASFLTVLALVAVQAPLVVCHEAGGDHAHRAWTPAHDDAGQHRHAHGHHSEDRHDDHDHGHCHADCDAGQPGHDPDDHAHSVIFSALVGLPAVAALPAPVVAPALPAVEAPRHVRREEAVAWLAARGDPPAPTPVVAADRLLV